MKFLHVVCCALLACLYAGGVREAAAEEVVGLPAQFDQPLGTHAGYLVEDGKPLDLEGAISEYHGGGFQPGRQRVLNFGIGSRPIWLHIAVENTGKAAAKDYLRLGVTWLDHVDVYLLHSGKVETRIRTGDETPHAPGLEAALGFILPLQFSPGRSDIYIRVESIDPMPLPLELVSGRQIHVHELHWGYYYGFFYGFLAALCIYNLLLFLGIGERSHLYYALTLIAVIFCNLSYTGHGVAWLWPGSPGFQRYVILVSMVLYSAAGLLFASRFLSLAEKTPRILRWVRGYAMAGLAAMVISVLLESQLIAALVAFTFTALFTVMMFLLGVLAVKRDWSYGRYFLTATFFAMLGVAATDLSVWGKIPFTQASFHATEIGLMLEATLLALALAYRVRQYRQAGLLAWQDPLTGLNNRRAFMELSSPYLSAHVRRERPLSIIIMDIDHFKQVNDEYGHKAGDEALVAVGKVLARHSRASDIVARWGGEEFILLLAETDLDQAVVYAERLRQAIADIRLSAGNRKIALTASFGIAMRGKDTELEEAIVVADTQLYRAKREGRNRICYPSG